MVALGYERPLVHRDVNVTNDKQAEFYARRVLAESRRASWQLIYTMAGHSTDSLLGGRAVWAVDTVVDVADDEFGLNGSLWIESVTHRRNPQTTTEIVLMRGDDLVFATGEAD
jgi:prophage tail gpP-like protein